MTTRTVRLDEEAERLLEDLVRTTGRSVSAVLREGLHALQRESVDRAVRSPWEVYRQLDLGPGGYAIGPSTASRQAVREALRRKHGR